MSLIVFTPAIAAIVLAFFPKNTDANVFRYITLATTINKAANHPMRNVPTIGVSATAKLMRSDWGLGAYVPAVSDEVELSIEVELLSQ